MKKVLIASVLCLVSVCAHAKSSWVAESEMIQSGKNFALVMGPRVALPNVSPDMLPLTFAYQAKQNVDQTIVNLVNAGWTCDNVSNAVGGKMEGFLKDPTLTDAQKNTFAVFRSSVVTYINAKCPELGGK